MIKSEAGHKITLKDVSIEHFKGEFTLSILGTHEKASQIALYDDNGICVYDIFENNGKVFISPVDSGRAYEVIFVSE